MLLKQIIPIFKYFNVKNNQVKSFFLNCLSAFIFVFVLLFAVSNPVYSQLNVRDSSVRLTLISMHIGKYVPGGDLAIRFGNNTSVGGSVGYKLKNNFIFSIEGSYLFSDNVKNEENYFHAIRNSNGYIIDANGMAAEIFLYERGFTFNATAAKLFPVLGPNPNSGIFVSFGVGYLQHHVRIENLNKVALQVVDDYSKYYDRLCSGFNMVQMIGYRYTSNNRLLNFYVGFEFNQAFTKSRRSFNIDDMGFDNSKRLDLTSGLRFGWVFPIYSRPPREFYYY